MKYLSILYLKRAAIVSLFCLSSLTGFSQCIGGSAGVCVGETVTYTLNPGDFHKASYTFSGGTKTGGGTFTSNYITINWTTAGWQNIYVEELDPNYAPYSCSLDVLVSPPVAGGSVSGSTTFCQGGSQTLTLSGHAGTVVRWESSPDGSTWTNIGNAGNTTYTASNLQSTTSYRAVLQSCFVQANSSAATITVNALPSTPSAPTIQSNCGTAVFAMGSAPGGVTWYWQDTNASGTSTANSSSTYSTSASGTYYLRARNNTTGCWSSSSSSVSVTVNALPSAPSAPTSNDNCGYSVLTRGTPPGGVTWYWQGSNPNGTSTADASSTYTVYGASTYYIRAYSSAGCWSSSSTAVNSSPLPAPDPPSTPTSSGNTCGDVTLYFNGSPGANTWWAWQTSPTGTSVGNKSSSYVVSASGTYYLRTYNYSTGCWSPDYSQITVTVNPLPATPSAPSASGTCGSSLLTRGNPPAGETWYWQDTNASGTSTANSNATYTVSASNTYYLRSRNNTTGCWSASSASVSATVNALPSTPASPTIQSACGTGVLARGTPPAGETWYWQGTNSSGTSTANSGSTYSTATSGTYYLRSMNNTTGCWSASSSSVSLTLNTLPATPTAPTIQGGTCGSAVLSRVTPPAGETWYWQDTNASGTSTSNSSTTYNTSVSNTYYLRSLNTAGCWSVSSSSVSVVVNPLPSAPTAPTIQSNCGTEVIARSTPPAGITWYWQDTNASGTSTSNSNTTYSTSTSGTYYLRGRDNTSLCWGSSTSIMLSVQTVPTASASNQTIFTGQTTSVAITNPNGVGGTTFSWTITQQTNVSGASNSSGSTIAQQLSTSAASGTVTYSITPSANGCNGTPISSVVTVYAQPVITAPQNYVVKGANVTLDAGAGYDTYSWKNSSNVVVGSARTYATSAADTYTATVTKSSASAGASFILHNQFYGVNMNYVVTNTVLAENITDPNAVDNLTVDQATQSIGYVDGLGRAIQTVVTQGSPAKADIVQPVVYDDFGREPKKYLPFVGENNGWYKADPVGKESGNYAASAQYQFYNNAYDKIADDIRPFNETTFEPSPLNRPLSDFGAGDNWKVNNKSVNHQYLVNQANEVYLFVYDANTGLVSLPSGAAGYYAAGQLQSKVTTDEHGNDVVEYVDKLSHTVCKKVQYGSDANGKLYACTYYIYDDFGNLVVVLPPEGVKAFTN